MQETFPRGPALRRSGLTLSKNADGKFALPAGTKCTGCGSTELTEPRPFNLMFKTYVGPVESEDSIAYLRPETAQAIFAQFKNVLETSRQKVPFGIAQIGKAFRNEVTPRNYTFRSREFEQMELEFFIKPDEVDRGHSWLRWPRVPETGHPGEPQPNWGWQAWHQYWVEERVRFYEGIGLSRDTLGFHHPDDGGTGALRPRLHGHFVQVPVQQEGRERQCQGRRTGRHRRAQRF